MDGVIRKTRRQFAWLITSVLLFQVALLLSVWWFVGRFPVSELNHYLLTAGAGTSLALLLGYILKHWFIKPLELIAITLGHLAPGDDLVSPPNLATLTVGGALTEEIVNRIYASVRGNPEAGGQPSVTSDENLKLIFELLPAAVITLDSELRIKFANQTARSYLGNNPRKLEDALLKDVFNLSFSGATNFESWIAQAGQDQITATKLWQRVKLTTADNKVYLFDMSAHYSKDEPHGMQVVIAMLDHTARYQSDEDALGFVALAVHELRTPITVLRGYIEVFQEELETKLTPELKGFMSKMDASAAQLSMFINNILNVSRAENNQLTLHRVELDWPKFLTQAVTNDLNLRANVRDRKINLSLPDELPTVAGDPLSVFEVLSNLVDNAIKYSHDGGQIDIRAQYNASEKQVETTVQDYGIGIPTSIIGNLFEKFYRSHRSKQNVGGNGLGLYLCKTIVEAHGGHISVQSTEGQGTAFTFTLPTYESISDKLIQGKNDGIERNSHGWIKNHSMYRR